MVKIVFDDDFPKEIKPEVSSIIDSLQPAMPKWLNTICVHYYEVSLEKASTASIVVQPEYRIADLCIHQFYFKLKTFDERATAISHEIAHVYTSSLINAFDFLTKLLPDEAKEVSLELGRVASESATEDLGYLFYKLIFEGGDGKKKTKNSSKARQPRTARPK